MEVDNKKETLALGTRPVGHLLMQYALPAMVAMTAASLYNIIDRVFIGQVVGPMAISGLAITFPFMNLGAAFGAAVGVGSSTSISVKLGQRDYQTAEQLLGNTVTLNLIIGIAFSVVSLLFLDPILRFFGASDHTLPYARAFMQIILLGNVVSHMYYGMNAVLRAASKPREAMIATILSVGLNIIFDFVFIYWWRWGIRGAALGTVVAQNIALTWQMKFFADKRQLLHLKRGIYRLKGSLVKLILSIGVSPFLMNATACVIVIFMNNQLVRYGGDLSVGAYGVANALAMVFMMFVMGLNQGMQPIAGYNYGSQQFDRLRRVVDISIIAGVCIMTVGWLVAMFLPHAVARLFTSDPQLTRLSVKAIRINMLMFPLVGAQMVITTFFQCIGKVKLSIFLSLSRQLIILLPLLLLLPLFFGIDGVWYSLPSSDFLAAVIAAVTMMLFTRKLNKEIQLTQHGGQEDNH
uniref:MATE family efflux transporter n=1 Tax=Prevotella sp. TaxID=59823 RepID=UPI004025C160